MNMKTNTLFGLFVSFLILEVAFSADYSTISLGALTDNQRFLIKDSVDSEALGMAASTGDINGDGIPSTLR